MSFEKVRDKDPISNPALEDYLYLVKNSSIDGDGKISLSDLKNLFIQSATISSSGISVLPKQITISNNVSDPNNDLDFTAGNAQADDGSLVFSVAALTKRLDATWVSGTNQGGLDTGAKAINTPYYCYAVYNPTLGLGDILYTATKGSPTMTLPNAAGYTILGEYLGACHTDGSANIRVGTYSYGKGIYDFSFTNHVTDLNMVIGNIGNLKVLSVPARSKARFTFGGEASGSGSGIIRAYDGTASSSGQTDIRRATGYFSVGVTAATGYVEAKTTALSQIKYDVIVTSGSPTLNGTISTQGWQEYL